MLTVGTVLLPGLQDCILSQASLFRDIEVFQRFRWSIKKGVLHGGSLSGRVEVAVPLRQTVGEDAEIEPG